MYSEETEEMLRERIGYRCHSYSVFRDTSYPTVDEIIYHEAMEMGNDHILEDVCKALGITDLDCSGRGHEDNPLDPREVDAIIDRVAELYGPGARALWLGTLNTVLSRYCTDDEVPESYPIPPEAIVLSDLGPDGALFLFPGW